jgi:hypothetical protein
MAADSFMGYIFSCDNINSDFLDAASLYIRLKFKKEKLLSFLTLSLKINYYLTFFNMTDKGTSFLDSLRKRDTTRVQAFSNSKKRKVNRIELDKQQETYQQSHTMTPPVVNSACLPSNNTSAVPMDVDAPSFELPELDFASLYNDQDILDIQKLLSGEVLSDAEDDEKEVETLPEDVPSDSEEEEEECQPGQSHSPQPREPSNTVDESKSRFGLTFG